MYILNYHSPAGLLELCSDGNALNAVSFLSEKRNEDSAEIPEVLLQTKKQLGEYFSGERKEFKLPLEQPGTDFQKRVWSELLNIPFGKTISYLELARRLGDEKTIRAAGTANGKNQIAIIVPCHRVIGSDGSLTGYAGGLHNKEFLLRHEGSLPGMEQMDLFGN